MAAFAAVALFVASGTEVPAQQPATPAAVQAVPPRVAQARRFLEQRGWGRIRPAASPLRPSTAAERPVPQTSAGSAAWQPVGPSAVISPGYGLVTGRVTAISFDPADATGNRVYIGTTGGGVWLSQNAGTSNATTVAFSPLTDAVGALSTAHDASISVGAISVQPGGIGVVLVGTGDPNDALDSYYGAGILRSAVVVDSCGEAGADCAQRHGAVGDGDQYCTVPDDVFRCGVGAGQRRRQRLQMRGRRARMG